MLLAIQVFWMLRSVKLSNFPDVQPEEGATTILLNICNLTDTV
jgi:hypothetical protein